VSSPWIRRYPHSGFSFASRTISRVMLRAVGGRPGLRCLLVSVLLRGQSAVPGQQRRWRHGEDLRPAPSGEEPRQRREPYPVGQVVPDPADVAAEHCVLVPEHQQLSSLCPVVAEHQRSRTEDPARQQVDDLEQHPASQPSRRPGCWRSGRSAPQSSIRSAHDRVSAVQPSASWRGDCPAGSGSSVSVSKAVRFI
jgi:hypothetical protein